MDEVKIKTGLVIATIVILIVGVFIISGKSGNTGGKVDAKILMNGKSHQTDSSVSTTLVEFSDYQCPACITVYPVVKQIVSDYKGKLNFVYRNFPLTQHKNAVPAASAAEAAAFQGKYWEMHDKIFTLHAEWENEADPTAVFQKYAKDLSLNIDKFNSDVKSDEVKKVIEGDYNDGTKTGLDATPTFFLNGVKLENIGSAQDFKKAIDEVIKNTSITQTSPVLAYHVHANIKVLINGTPVDFSLAKYQSKDGKELDENIHFHDGVGDVFHIHKKGMTLGDLFKSMGMTLDSTCLVSDTKEKYCTDSKKSLKMYVNGVKNDQYEKYVPQDLDGILVSYGSEDDAKIETEIAQVADTACIYSEKCPDRGKPPSEECTGGTGTVCK
jgi:protein-disulfide isomerase